MKWTALLLLLSAAAAGAASEPEEVVFPSGHLELHGFIHRPAGDGPFAAILYNHGSEPRPGFKPELARIFTDAGYVFFVPHRRGQGRSPRDGRLFTLGALALNEMQLEDQLAALDFLKKLSYVDAGRIAVAGCSFGGIQTILAVEAEADRKLGLRAAVDFAGAAETWRTSGALQDRLIRAVRKATVPVMFVQAKNDYDLTPSYTLAKELEKLGKPHKLSIYPPYGTTVRDGHGGFCARGGVSVWAPEVLAFLAASLQK
jgi:dipeptidyl aminopeptidase/acylaminoacyl peptidase